MAHPPGSDAAEPAGAADPHRPPVVLVVDDEPAIRTMLDVALSLRGFTVLAPATGEEALEMYRLRGGEIDLVLSDVRMPGLDGPALLAALRNLNPQVRCCFMSGDLGGYTVEGLLGLGICAVLGKPLDLAGLVRTLREVLAGPQDRGAARPVQTGDPPGGEATTTE